MKQRKPSIGDLFAAVVICGVAGYITFLWWCYAAA